MNEELPAVVGILPEAEPEVAEEAQEAAQEVAESALEEPVEETSADAETAPEAAEEEPDWQALIAEAEERGYLRGRNENIAQLMERPGVFERLGCEVREEAPTGGVEILSRERRSIWDL